MGDTVKAVGNCSYNQLVEKIISCKQSDSSELAGEGGWTDRLEGCVAFFLAASPLHIPGCLIRPTFSPIALKQINGGLG